MKLKAWRSSLTMSYFTCTLHRASVTSLYGQWTTGQACVNLSQPLTASPSDEFGRIAYGLGEYASHFQSNVATTAINLTIRQLFVRISDS